MQSYPFCKTEFFDQFEQGSTVLYLGFVKETTERTEPIFDSTKMKRICRVDREVIGIYRGRDEKVVRLQIAGRGIDAVPAADIRVFKELKAKELEEIMELLQKISTDFALALCQPPSMHETNLSMTVTALNELRAMIDRYAILVPRAAMA